MTYAPIFCAKSAPQAALPYIAVVSEKRPCSTFPYQSTQTAKTPTTALNLRFWAFPSVKHARINEKSPFSLIHAPTCTIQVHQLVCPTLLRQASLISATRSAHTPSSNVIAYSHARLGVSSACPPFPVQHAEPYALICRTNHLENLLQSSTPVGSRQSARAFPKARPATICKPVSSKLACGGWKGCAQLFLRHAPCAKRLTIRLALRTWRGNVFLSCSPFPVVFLAFPCLSCLFNLFLIVCTLNKRSMEGSGWDPFSCGLDPAASIGGTSRRVLWQSEALKKMTLALGPCQVCDTIDQACGRVLALSISPESRTRPYQSCTPEKDSFFSLALTNGCGCPPVPCTPLQDGAIPAPDVLSTTNTVTRGALFTILFFSFLSFILLFLSVYCVKEVSHVANSDSSL